MEESMRIASLSPAATEILFCLGLGEQIVCTDQFSNFPEAAKALPHVKGHTEVDISVVTEHEPDLVLTSAVIQERLTASLRQSGISVIHQDPRTINAVYDGIREFGQLFDCEQSAAELVRTMQEEFNATKRKAALLPRKIRVYVEEWHKPPMASGNWVPEVVKLAGGEVFPIVSGELSREVTLKEVQAFAPELLVISWCGAGSLADPAVLTQRTAWSELAAARAGSVRVIDDALLNRPGPRLPEGAQRLYGWMFEMLH